MSYGHSKLRDIRRQSALPRLELALVVAQKAAKAQTNKEDKTFDKKVAELQKAIDNTKTNQGKGTSAMQKPKQKAKQVKGML